MKSFSMKRGRRLSQEIWQVIYIDLMTNVMAFFLLLWALSQGKESGVSETVGDETTRMISLPGDVLFPPGKTNLTDQGRTVFSKLFSEDSESVLDFETTGLVKRLLVVHGHTDSDGGKEENFALGFTRALSAYEEIRRYSRRVPDHVVICSHADNTPEQEVPKFEGRLSEPQQQVVKGAKAKNRRITIEDKVVNLFKDE